MKQIKENQIMNCNSTLCNLKNACHTAKQFREKIVIVHYVI